MLWPPSFLLLCSDSDSSLRCLLLRPRQVFTTPRDVTGLQGIHFRFMPDLRQIGHALQLYNDAGVPTKQFIGVPVFQAEGLTVTTQEMVGEGKDSLPYGYAGRCQAELGGEAK